MEIGKLYKFTKDYVLADNKGHDHERLKQDSYEDIFLCVGFEYENNVYGNSRPYILLNGKIYSFFLGHGDPPICEFLI